SQDMESINYFKVSMALTAMAAAVVMASGLALAVGSVDTSAGDFAAGTADTALDRALKKLIAMPGGPPGVIAIVQRGTIRKVHRFGVADLSNDQPMRVNDHMRIASVAKAFSGA